MHWKLNTSNLGKFEEYKRLFANQRCSLEATHIDQREIDADPLDVVTYKASLLGDHILVDDTSLEIEGVSIGVHVKWFLQHLPDYMGRKSLWTVLLAYRVQDEVLIYRGMTEGVIVESKGYNGFGFDPFFLPNGASQTLAQFKPDQINARAKAIAALLQGDVYLRKRPIVEWDGPWQGAG